MNLHDEHQLKGAKMYMEAGDHLKALDMFEKLLKQYPKHGEIKSLTLRVRKKAALKVPVVVKTKESEVVVRENEEEQSKKAVPNWWRKFF
jgi:tetratricopeptide (TPR) repeat protein